MDHDIYFGHSVLFYFLSCDNIHLLELLSDISILEKVSFFTNSL